MLSHRFGVCKVIVAWVPWRPIGCLMSKEMICQHKGNWAWLILKFTPWMILKCFLGSQSDLWTSCVSCSSPIHQKIESLPISWTRFHVRVVCVTSRLFIKHRLVLRLFPPILACSVWEATFFLLFNMGFISCYFGDYFSYLAWFDVVHTLV